ncbi:MAG TPA: FG-GAP-like repeat-containing protein [Solirubrobacteraceae bacterium]
MEAGAVEMERLSSGLPGRRGLARTLPAAGTAAIALAMLALLLTAPLAGADGFSVSSSSPAVPAGARSTSVALGHLLGDTALDIALNNVSAKTAFSLRSNGGGAFTQSPLQSAGTSASSFSPAPDQVAIGDLNGDGRDVVFDATAGSNSVTMFSPGAAPSTSYTPAQLTGTSTGGADIAAPVAVATGDLNGDGKPDLAIANSTDDTVQILYNNGTGTLANGAAAFTVGPLLNTDPGPTALAIGDLNGDGIADLAVTSSGEGENGDVGSLMLFLGDANHDGGFAPTSLPVDNPSSVAIGDLTDDGNGATDLVVTNQDDATVTLFLKDLADASYTTTTLATGDPSTSTPWDVAIGDLNGDGLSDLAVADNGASSVEVFLKDAGDAGYSLTTLATTGNQPAALAIGDVTGDGKPDIVTANASSPRSVTLFTNTTTASASATLTAAPPAASAGQMVTFTDTLSGGAGGPVPTGGVVFSIDGVAQPSVPVSGGVASFSTAALSSGPHAISADYSGDASYAAGTSSITYSVTAIAPTATTGAATGVTESGATLTGTVGPNGSATSYVFEYGTSTSFGSITPADTVAGNAAVAESAGLSGLTPDTTYFYRLVAANSAGTVMGAVASFSTGGPLLAPAAVTLPAGSVGNTTADVTGSVDPEGQATAFTFEYGTSTSFGTISTVTELDSAFAVEPVSATLTGLAQNTTYFYRVVASNATGTSTGAVGSFSTGPGGVPIVTTGSASNLTVSGATLSGTVNPAGEQTAFTFEFGEGNNFGSISAVDNAGSGEGPQTVSLPISGLQPNTTYVYRIDATNASGTSTGAVETFTTP